MKQRLGLIGLSQIENCCFWRLGFGVLFCERKMYCHILYFSLWIVKLLQLLERRQITEPRKYDFWHFFFFFFYFCISQIWEFRIYSLQREGNSIVPPLFFRGVWYPLVGNLLYQVTKTSHLMVPSSHCVVLQRDQHVKFLIIK